MTNNDNDNDNRIELIGLNEFIQDDENDIELGDEDERPFPDSDEEIRALQDVAESVDELLDEAQRLRAENKLLRAERDEARKTCCRLWQKEDSAYITVQRLAEDQGWDCFTTNA
jgi:hypothetical protein